MTDPGYRDVTCSFCGRHNRQVHMVEGRGELRICQVCVAAAAESIDADAGVPPPPGGWSTRWSFKVLLPARGLVLQRGGDLLPIRQMQLGAQLGADGRTRSPAASSLHSVLRPWSPPEMLVERW